ncbi:MAG: 4Fe-4S dicluster domain-containing protein [Planctomycetota bacterium]
MLYVLSEAGIEVRFMGGYNMFPGGRPSGSVKVLPEPEVLYLPLCSGRFTFSELGAREGERVSGGDILAKDPDNYAVPLLAPRTGTVRLKSAEKHIVLEDVAELAEHAHVGADEMPHIVQEMGASGIKRYKLLVLGAWQFFYDAYTGALPDPLGKPQAVVVSTVSLEPYLARGDAQLHEKLLNFTRGLEHLQSLLEYEPIYLIMPHVKSEFATQVREQIRGYAWAKLTEIPLKYPYDNFNILARALGLKRNNGPIWAVRTEGVLAVDRALTSTKPCTSRIITVGGPGVDSPTHVEVVTGYPIKKILDTYVSAAAVRSINGGVFTGEPLGAEDLGVDAECRGLTVVPELEEREFLGFARPGSDRRSYSGCFLSSLRDRFGERFSTAIRGEDRACVACNFCEEVCPAGIMPYLLHKYLYRELIEEAEEARVDLCVRCGLCSFVCPSKIELRREFVEAQELIKKEKEDAQRQVAEEKVE